jgi:hypothetical protein
VKRLNHFSMRFKAVRQVLEAYPEVFEGKPQLEEALASFNTITNELATAITPLVVPYNALRAEMAQSREALRAELNMLLSLSGVIADRTGDVEFEITIKNLKAYYRSVSGAQLVQMTLQLANMLESRSEVAASVGISPERLSALRQLITRFEQKIADTNLRMGNRAADRQRTAMLITQANQLLLKVLDPFVRFQKPDYPAFAFAYERVRKIRMRRPARKTLPEDASISGMVTNALTGEPVAGAILILKPYDEVQTAGADGYFLFDGLEPGTYTLSCHAKGYQLPADAVLEAGINDSLIHNFELQAAG